MLRIALTGAHGTGKTYIIHGVERALRDEGFTVRTIPSLTRKLKDAGYPINEESLEESARTQLVCGALRDYEQQLALQDEPDVLLSDRCILDEILYTEYFLSEAKTYSGRGSLARVLEGLKVLNQREIKDNFWDAIFLKEPHPDFLPEHDQHRSTDLRFFNIIAGRFEQVQDSRVRRDLPRDRDEAVKFLVKYYLDFQEYL